MARGTRAVMACVTAWVLIGGVLIITSTAMVGLVATDLGARQAIVDTSTSLSVLHAEVLVDDVSVGVQSVGLSWRRQNRPLHTTALDQLLLAEASVSASALTRQYSNMTSVSALISAGVSFLWITNSTGHVHGVAKSPEGGFQIILFSPITMQFQTFNLTSSGQRVLPAVVRNGQGLDPRTRRWYLAAMSAQGNVTWSTPYSDGLSSEIVMTVAVAIKDSHGCDISYAILADVMSDLPIRSEPAFLGTNVLLVTSRGGIVAASSAEDNSLLSSLYNRPITQSGLVPLNSTGLSPAAHASGVSVVQSSECMVGGRLLQYCSLAVPLSQAGSYTTIVSMRRFEKRAAGLGANWAVMTYVSVPSPLSLHMGKLVTSVVLVGLVIVVTLFKAVPALRTVDCRKRRPSAVAHEAAVELHEWGPRRSGQQASVLGVASAAQSEQQQAQPAPPPAQPEAKTESRSLTLFSAIVLLIMFALWGQVLDAHGGLATSKATLLGRLMQLNVNALLAKPVSALQQTQTALAMGQLPFDPLELAPGSAAVSVAFHLLLDMLRLYDASFIPISAVLVGYPNGDSFGSEFHEGIITWRYRTAATGGDLWFELIGQNDQLTGDVSAVSVAYNATRRPWYRVSQTATPAGTAMYTAVYPFAQEPGAPTVYGVTMALRVTDPLSGRMLVLGIDLTLDRLTHVFNVLAPPASDGIMFLAEDVESLPLVAASTFAAACGTDLTARLTAADASLPGSPMSLMAQALRSNDSEPCPSSCLLTVGNGMQKTITSVTKLHHAGVQWVLAVGMFNSSFVRVLVPYDNVVMVIAAACVWLVLSTLNRLSKAVKSASPQHAGGPGSGAPDGPSLLDQLEGEALRQQGALAALQTFEQFIEEIVGDKQGRQGHQTPNPLRGKLASSPVSTRSFRQGPSADPWNPATDPVWASVCMVTGAPRQWHTAPDQEAVEEVVFRFAQQSLRGLHPSKLVVLLIATDFSRFHLRVAQVLASRLWQQLCLLLAWGSMVLVGFEMDTKYSVSSQRTTHAIETAIIAVQIVNWVMLVTTAVAWRQSVRIANSLASGNQAEGSPAHLIVGRQPRRMAVLGLHTVLVFAMLVDILVRWSYPYALNAAAPEVMLPVSAMLRPLLVVVYSAQIRASASHLLSAVARSRAVVAVMWSVLLFVSLVTVVIIHDTATPAEAFAQGLTDIRASVLTMFVFLFTQANYLDVVLLAMDESPWLLLYIAVVTFVGVMLLVSLLIAAFQSSYAQSFSHREKLRSGLLRARQRIGLFLAYRCLHAQASRAPAPSGNTLTGGSRVASFAQAVQSTRFGAGTSMRISQVALMAFFARKRIAVQPASTQFRETLRQFDTFAHDLHETVQSLQGMAHSGGCDMPFVSELEALLTRCKQVHLNAQRTQHHGYVDVTQFVQTCEKHASQFVGRAGSRAAADPGQRSSPSRGERLRRQLRRFFDDATLLPYTVVLDALIKVHVACLALSTTLIAGVTDTMLVALVVGFAVEVYLRILAEGFRSFWTWPRLHAVAQRGQSFVVQSFKADVVINATSLLLVVLGTTLQQTLLTRIGTTLPALRLFTCSPTKRSMVFGLIGSLPEFAPLVLLQVILMYLYIVAGSWWFGGQLQSEDPRLRFSNFDSLAAAVAVMFQLLSGDGWADTMYVAVQARGSLYPILYFLTFVLFFVLMFTNVVIGIIVEAYQELEAAREQVVVTDQAMQRLNQVHVAAQSAKLKRFFSEVLARRRRKTNRAQSGV